MTNYPDTRMYMVNTRCPLETGVYGTYHYVGTLADESIAVDEIAPGQYNANSFAAYNDKMYESRIYTQVDTMEQSAFGLLFSAEKVVRVGVQIDIALMRVTLLEPDYKLKGATVHITVIDQLGNALA